jgi:hypothetical protein
MQVFQPSSVLSVVFGQASIKYEHCAVFGSMLCHSWGHYVTAKCKSFVRLDIKNASPLGPAIELH